ncbi:MAG TPA: DUF4386 domain-containing protein [Cyclobacteriaceae bacterium]|nr:DUF4386 domain-containing protein [Cyclobacteriaceae bacterium]HMV10487.1 DUF4386 domain-containing protein [Cyclobacteriaceae bacterium]HMV90386.1 DUF4386 domain-containing protein [Cyclobacteriaceae bacterium]HMX01780.1 DUF4386 domain-containing protein [Cyclobacteriaceae bacterium]HMX51527.1 DUF4386 domain-containing protein [Cyclobacteriaceae bacterium]
MNTIQSSAGPDSASRKTARLAGIIYLITFISIPTLSLYAPLRTMDYVTGTGHDISVVIGCILEMLVGLGCIGSAVVLYPVLRKQNETLAMGLISARILEAATIFVGVSFVLTILSLRQAGVGGEAGIIAYTLAALYDRIFLIGQSFMPAVNDLLLGFLLYHSRLVPRNLARIGIAGGVSLIVGDVLILLGVLEQREPLAAVFSIGVAVFEFILGIWLVVKGFQSPHAK